MEITLNSKMQQWIDEKVDSGLYNNSSEIIIEGLTAC
jgi:putative addiction module CopG family antidote